MCRVYETAQGPYTRLCYRTGRRGQRLPGRRVGPGGHVAPQPRSRKPSAKRRRPALAPRRCALCRGPVSRHDAVCSLCRDGR